MTDNFEITRANELDDYTKKQLLTLCSNIL